MEPSLKEKLYGKAKSLAEKLAELKPEIQQANSTVSVIPEKQPDYVRQKPEEPVIFGIPGIEKTKKKPLRVIAEPFSGTNYDPYDPEQNRPDTTPEDLGKGASGIKINENMVAVPRKKDSDEAMLRLGTVLRVPETGKLILVADLTSREFDGQNKLDFATPKTGKKIKSEVNKEFNNLEVLREGQGYKDVRDFVESGEWEKMLKEYEE